MLQPISIEPGQATADTLIRLRQQIDLLELAFSRLASNFESSDYYEDEGFTSPINWIRVNCHMNAGAVADRIAVGDCMDQLPESLQSVNAGDVGFAHLVVMARTAQAVPDFDESELLRDAKKGTPGKFHHHCDHYRHAKDPARFAKEQAELVEHRKLELKAWENGMLSIKGCLDPVGGAVVRGALESLARRDGWQEPRVREQRLADALVELAGMNQKVNLQVTSSVETLLGLVGSPAAETEFSLPISAKTVERWACDCSLTRVLLDSDSQVIDVGRSKRVISGSRRRALEARDGGCRWPGCDRSPKWTDGHHVVFWAHGGDGGFENQILLCRRHHWMVHEGNWQLIKTADGEIKTIRPPDMFSVHARGPD